MKYIILLTLILIVGCTPQEYSTSPMKLRQLITKEAVTENSKANYFLIWAEYKHSEKEETKVRMFVNVDGAYRFMDFNIKDISIIIDNTIEVPHLIIKTIAGENWNPTNSDIIETVKYDPKTKIIISCPENYLPEKLLPIEL